MKPKIELMQKTTNKLKTIPTKAYLVALRDKKRGTKLFAFRTKKDQEAFADDISNEFPDVEITLTENKVDKKQANRLIKDI